jgi:hypothetical protein
LSSVEEPVSLRIDELDVPAPFTMILIIVCRGPKCGRPPSLSSAPDMKTESEAVQVQADLLSKLAGTAQLAGQIDAARKTVQPATIREPPPQKNLSWTVSYVTYAVAKALQLRPKIAQTPSGVLTR